MTFQAVASQTVYNTLSGLTLRQLDRHVHFQSLIGRQWSYCCDCHRSELFIRYISNPTGSIYRKFCPYRIRTAKILYCIIPAALASFVFVFRIIKSEVRTIKLFLKANDRKFRYNTGSGKYRSGFITIIGKTVHCYHSQRISCIITYIHSEAHIFAGFYFCLIWQFGKTYRKIFNNPDTDIRQIAVYFIKVLFLFAVAPDLYFIQKFVIIFHISCTSNITGIINRRNFCHCFCSDRYIFKRPSKSRWAVIVINNFWFK